MAWLYVPGLVELTSGLNSQYQGTGLCVTSSGKPSVRPSSWRGWKTRPWRGRLSGTTLPPSTASRGMESWILSLRDSRVSRTALRGSAPAPQIPDGSGTTSPGSSGRSIPGSYSSRTFLDSSRQDLNVSGEIFGEWVSRWKRVSSLRQKSALRIGGSGSSSWPTPNALQGGQTSRSGDRRGEKLMGGIIRNWPTPNAAVSGSRSGEKAHPGRGLRTEAEMWGTPSAHDGRRPGPDLKSTEGSNLSRQAPKGDSQMVLNPRFVEWLMGMPVGWTAFEPLGMGLFRQWSQTHGKHLRSRLD